MTRATIGPWRVREYPSRGTNIEWGDDDSVERPICHMRWTDGMRPEVELEVAADAKLIAAAPNLLAALRSVLRDSANDCFCDPDKQFYCSSCSSRALIARIES
jgi:hypothetical protein